MGNFAVFGLGYVGTTMAAALASQGHHVVGVDPDAKKRRMIGLGTSPVGEAGLTEWISAGRDRGLIEVTGDAAEALEKCSLSFVCVGTPSRPDGGIDLGAIFKVSEEIASHMPDAESKTGVIYRSTMIPGTMEEKILSIFQHAAPGDEEEKFELAYYPEFMREGTAWEDFLAPPMIVVGTRTPWIRDAIADTFPDSPAPIFWTDFRTAEMAKYVSNSWHAVKISFANEVGILAKETQVNVRDLMRIFTSDRKLNISEAYLRPGFAFGGSCLGKDVEALRAAGRESGLPLPFLTGVMESNQFQIERVFEVIRGEAGDGPVGFVGLAFKTGTDDLRDSPYLKLASRIEESGLKVKWYDPDIQVGDLTGSNLRHAEATWPGLAEAAAPSVESIWNDCGLVVLNRGTKAGSELMVRNFADRGGYLVDLTGTDLFRRWAGKAYWSVV